MIGLNYNLRGCLAWFRDRLEMLEAVDYRELWTDPEFLEMVTEYVEAHTGKCEGWHFETAYREPLSLAADAHKIAGSAGMYGFPDITDAARALETAIRSNGTPEAAQALFEDLKNRISIAAEELATFKAGQGS